MSDLYFDFPEEDDEEEESSSSDRPVNEVISGKASAATEFRSITGESLPKSVRKNLGLGDDNVRVFSESFPNEFIALVELFHYMSGFGRYNTLGPLVLAMAEVLDEMTEGRVSLLHRLHAAERRILTSKAAIFIMETTFNIINESEAKNKLRFWNEVSLYLEVYTELFSSIKENVIEEYRDLCIKLDREVDEDLIETGILQERSQFMSIALGNPPARRDLTDGF